ncbi:MAG: TonB-dependent receptor, partial [Acidobacteriota bacterium]
PDSVSVFNTPVNTSLNQLEVAAFVQDSWTVARRLTINAGARFERLTGSLDEQSAPAGQFVPERHFDAQPNVIVWNNMVPRLSAAYDVTGAGRTVVKASLSQFTQRQGATLINQFNPLRQNQEVRTWLDANGDLIPQLTEIGPSQGTLERGATVRVDDNLIRPTQWETTVGVEQQVSNNLSFSVSYFRRRYQNLTAVVNTAVSAADYTPLATTNPLDGTPFTVYTQSAASIGRVDNVLLNSDLLTQKYDGVEMTVNRRFDKNLTLFGGLTVGNNKSATSASRNPNDRLNVSGYDPLDSHVILNLSGIYQLPYALSFSSHLAFYSGQPLRRIYTMSPTLVPGLRQTTQDVLLVPTGTYRKPDQTLLDIRVGRKFRASNGLSIEPLIEAYNLLNENGSLTEVEQVGASLGRISRNIDGRLVRFSIKVAF